MKNCPKCGHSSSPPQNLSDLGAEQELGEDGEPLEDEELALQDEALAELEEELEGSAADRLKGPSVHIEVKTGKPGKKKRDDEDA